LNKKYGIAAIIAGVIIVVVLVFTYGSNASTNPAIQNQQPSVSNSTTINPSASTTGRHFFASANESITITTNP
jgi:hypothetical protein